MTHPAPDDPLWSEWIDHKGDQPPEWIDTHTTILTVHYSNYFAAACDPDNMWRYIDRYRYYRENLQ